MAQGANGSKPVLGGKKNTRESDDGTKSKFPHWACKATAQCGFLHNFASREMCKRCGRDQKGQWPKNGNGGEPSTRTLQRQTRVAWPRSYANAAASDDNAQMRKLEASNKQLQQKLQRLEQQLEQQAQTPTSEAPAEAGPEELEDLAKSIRDEKAKLASVRQLPDDVPGKEAMFKAVQSRIDALVVQRESKKPSAQQLREVEAAIETAEGRLSKAQDKVDKAEEWLQKHRDALTRATEDLVEKRAKRAEIVAALQPGETAANPSQAALTTVDASLACDISAASSDAQRLKAIVDALPNAQPQNLSSVLENLRQVSGDLIKALPPAGHVQVTDLEAEEIILGEEDSGEWDAILTEALATTSGEAASTAALGADKSQQSELRIQLTQKLKTVGKRMLAKHAKKKRVHA